MRVCVFHLTGAHLGILCSLCSRCVFLTTTGYITPGHHRDSRTQTDTQKIEKLMTHVTHKQPNPGSEPSYVRANRGLSAESSCHCFHCCVSFPAQRRHYLCGPRKDPPNDLIELINNDKTSNQHAGFLKALVWS